MNRGRKVALLAHCLLNANTRVDGLARYAGVHPVVAPLVERGFGLVQLPCPEMTAMGLKRWAQTFEQYDTPFFRAHCARLAEDIAVQVAEYVRCGYDVGPVVGLQGSPSCGVTQTTSGDWGGRCDGERTPARSERVDGSGVFMRELAQRLERFGVRFTWVDDREPEGGATRVVAVVDGDAR